MNENENQNGQIAEAMETEEKRHRGRPRKYERDGNGKPIMPPELDENGKPVPKRHRGRPKKEVEEIEPKVPKKRGRPRKDQVDKKELSPETKAEMQPETKAETQPEMKAGMQSVMKAEMQPETKAETQSGAKAGKQSETKSAGKPVALNALPEKTCRPKAENPIGKLFAGMVGSQTKAKYHNLWHYSTLRRAYQNRVRYTILMVTEHKDGTIKQFNIHDKLLSPCIAVILVVILVLGGSGIYKSVRLKTLQANCMDQASLITGLETDNSRLEIENESLSDKVTVLSDTVKQKMEEEQTAKAAAEEQSMPKGLPIDTNAAIEEGVTGENSDPIVIFTAPESASVIATGSGKVTAVEADAEYGTRIKIDHGNGLVSIYRNAGTAKVKVDDEITRGWILFVVGEENTALGYQIEENDTYINPVDVMDING